MSFERTSLCSCLSFLFPLFKGKGSTTEAASFREIMIGNSLGKPAAKHARFLAKTPVNNAAVETQYGSGIGGRFTDFAHIYLRALADIAYSKGMCISFIFADVTPCMLPCLGPFLCFLLTTSVS